MTWRPRPGGPTLEGRGPRPWARRWRAAVAASPTTRRRPGRWWRCPTGTAAGRWPTTLDRGPGAGGGGPGPQLHGGPAPSPRRAARATGTSRCARPSSSRPISSLTPRGACPGASRHAAGQRGGLRGQVDVPGGRRGPATGRRARAARSACVFSREDVVRYGPKRPPDRRGRRADGSGVVRVARTAGSVDLDRWVQAAVAGWPRLVVEVVEVPGPPVSADLRGAGWVEAAVLVAALEAAARRSARAGPAGHGAVARRRRRPRPRCRRRGASSSRSRRVTRSTRSCCGPTPWARRTRRSGGSAAKVSPSTPTAPCSTSPSGPSASSPARAMPTVRVDGGRRCAAAGARRATPSLLLSPPRRGWRPGSRPSWPVGREEVACELLRSGPTPRPCAPAVARVLGTARRRTGRPTAPCSSPGGFEAQARQALANVRALLAGARLGWDNVVKTTVFLTDMADYGDVQRDLHRGARRPPTGPVRGRRGRAAARGAGRDRGVGLRRGPEARLSHGPWASVRGPRCRGRSGSRPSGPSR